MRNIFTHSQNLKVIVQGATGTEGQRAVQFMKNYHTKIVAGVTPGKGGQIVHDVPIYNSVAEAIALYGPCDATSIYVPPAANLAAVREALENNIGIIHILTEGTPYKDLALIHEVCDAVDAVLLGPGSLGLIMTDTVRLGMLGGNDPQNLYRPGHWTVISRSGGMTNELANYLYHTNTGIRGALHLGSEKICGLRLPDIITMTEEDPETHANIIFEELTYSDLQEIELYYQQHPHHKPTYLIIAGSSLDSLPSNTAFGHLESLQAMHTGNLSQRIQTLQQLGITILTNYNELSHYLHNHE